MYLGSELIASWKTKVSERAQNSLMHVTKQINQAWQSINQSMRKSRMLGPTKAQFIFAQINFMNSTILNYEIYLHLF